MARHNKPPLSGSTRNRRAPTGAITFDVKMDSSGKILRKLAYNKVRAIPSNKTSTKITAISTADGLKIAGLTFGDVVEVQDNQITDLSEQEKSDDGNGEVADGQKPKSKKNRNRAEGEIKSKNTKGVGEDEKLTRKTKSEVREHESDSPSVRRGRVVRASSDGKLLDIVMDDCSLCEQIPCEQVPRREVLFVLVT